MKKSNYDKRMFGLAESLIRDIERADKPVQPEDLMLWIQTHVPRTETEEKEFDEELAEMMPDRPSPGRSSINELRKALGFTDEMSLLSVIRSATEVCQRVKEENQSGVTAKRFKGFWCPDVCPITLLPFFMWIEHPEFGWVPTYGGPYDSYTIPEPEDGKCKNRFEVEYLRYRFDHDEGGWLIDEVECVTERVIHEETLIKLNAWPDEA